jgi:hypothetical protein
LDEAFFDDEPSAGSAAWPHCSLTKIETARPQKQPWARARQRACPVFSAPNAHHLVPGGASRQAWYPGKYVF